jgi:putative ABC transport system permease protein
MLRSGPFIILFLAWRGLRQYGLSSMVAAFAIALAGGLFLSTWKIKEDTKKAFNLYDGGFDAVLGVRGSKVELVLNSVFHVSNGPDNFLTPEQYESIRDNRAIKEAIPLSVGDNYKGYRIVGTIRKLFDEHEWRKGRKYELAAGKLFDDNRQEAVVGFFAARKLGIKVGQVINPYHGLDYAGEDSMHENEYVVVGVLEPTGTPADRVVWIPIQGALDMPGHAEGLGFAPSSVLVKFQNKAKRAMLKLNYDYLHHPKLMMPLILKTIAPLFEKFKVFELALTVIAALVAATSAGVILATLRSAMNEKRREIAILRSLGARRATVTASILAHAGLITLIGILGAFALFALIGNYAANEIQEEAGVIIEIFQYDPIFLKVSAGMLALGLLSGLLPALQAYRSDVAQNLTPTS